FFFQAEDGIRDRNVTGVQTCALPISPPGAPADSDQAAHLSRAARRSRAADVGSAAPVIARTTTTRLAPASTTSPRVAESIPPIANHGRESPTVVAAWRTRSRPGAWRPGLVGVGQTGPVQK